MQSPPEIFESLTSSSFPSRPRWFTSRWKLRRRKQRSPSKRLGSLSLSKKVRSLHYISKGGTRQVNKGLKTMKFTKRVLEELPFVLGKILYSSGDAVNTMHSIIDWAICRDTRTSKENYLVDLTNCQVLMQLGFKII